MAARALSSHAPSPASDTAPRQRRGVIALQLTGAAPFTDAVSDSRSRSNMTSTMAREPASADRSPRVPLTICTGSRAYAGGVMALEKLTARGAPTSEMW